MKVWDNREKKKIIDKNMKTIHLYCKKKPLFFVFLS